MKLFDVILIITLANFEVFAQVNFVKVNIKPLVSNRLDVEQKLGKPSGDCNCIYEMENFKVTVNYSQRICDDGWKVSQNTVLSYSLKPKKDIFINELITNEQDYFVLTTDYFSSSYINLEKGQIVYTYPFGQFEELKVNSIQIIPSITQGKVKKLRCQNATIYAPMNPFYIPRETIELKNRIDVISSIFIASAKFSQEDETKMYVLIYFSDGTTKRKKKYWKDLIHKNLKKALLEFKKEAITIEGGKRDKSEMEIFILPNNFPPPVPKS